MRFGNVKHFLALSCAVASVQASSRVLAVCAGSEGVALYVAPKSTGWTGDTVKKGSFTFLMKDNGEPDILIKDANEKTFSVVGDGSLVLAPFFDADQGTFTFILISKKATSVQTYQLSDVGNGKRVMLWTDVKNRTAGVLTKVSAYIAGCEPAVR